MNEQFFSQLLSRLNGIYSNFRWCRIGAFCFFVAFTSSNNLLAQGELTNGGNHDGSITLEEQDIWSFTANEGDKIFVRAAQLSGGTTFAPRVRIYNDGGTLVGYTTGGSSTTKSMALLELVVPSSGDFTIAVDSVIELPKLGHVIG